MSVFGVDLGLKKDVNCQLKLSSAITSEERERRLVSLQSDMSKLPLKLRSDNYVRMA